MLPHSPHRPFDEAETLFEELKDSFQPEPAWKYFEALLFDLQLPKWHLHSKVFSRRVSFIHPVGHSTDHCAIVATLNPGR